MTVSVAAVLAAAAAVAAADPPPAANRPRIGLVLSGGGARGCAHVGVLKVLEELRVPVDAVAGTSMGAVVGGLYAAGMSVEALERAVVTTDWSDLFVDRPARRDLPFRRKEEDWRYIQDLELGFVGGRLTIPPGVIAGQKFSFALARHALPAAGVADFDTLRVPFRAVAADVIAGRRVVLAGGDLATAIRASMSIPTVFAPVELDGMLLVDGGVVDNLPVDVARAMGVDVVIAVDVGTPPPDRDELSSLVGISKSVNGILAEERAREQRAAADLVLTPRLDQVGAMDFHRANEIVGLGERAARRAADSLRRWALSESEYRDVLHRQRQEASAPLRIDVVRVEGLKRLPPEIVTRRMATQPGASLDADVLRADLDRLYTLGAFEAVTFAIEDSAGERALVVRAKEKPWGPHLLRFAVQFQSDLEGTNSFTALVNYTRTTVNRFGAEWRTDFTAGRTRGGETEFYQPLDLAGRFFVVPGGRAVTTDYTEWEEGRRVATYRLSQALGRSYLGANLGAWGEFRLGLVQGNGRMESGDSGPLIRPFSFRLGAAEAVLTVDRLDNVNIPRRGVYAFIDLLASRPAIGADEHYDRGEGLFAAYSTRGRWTGSLAVAGGTNFGHELPPYAEFAIGGLLSFSGFHERELVGQAYATVRLGAYRNVFRPDGTFAKGMYCGGWAEAGNIWASLADASTRDLRYAGTLACGADTLVGPLYLAVGKANTSPVRAYLSLGRRF